MIAVTFAWSIFEMAILFDLTKMVVQQRNVLIIFPFEVGKKYYRMCQEFSKWLVNGL